MPFLSRELACNQQRFKVVTVLGGQLLRFGTAAYGAYSVATALHDNLQRMSAPEPAAMRGDHRLMRKMEDLSPAEQRTVNEITAELTTVEQELQAVDERRSIRSRSAASRC